MVVNGGGGLWGYDDGLLRGREGGRRKETDRWPRLTEKREEGGGGSRLFLAPVVMSCSNPVI